MSKKTPQQVAAVAATLKREDIPEGMVAMLCPEGGTGCSFDGVEYTANEEGEVVVPAAAVAQLLDHDFLIL